MLSFQNLQLEHNGGETVFDGFSLTIERGAFIAVLGPNGAGKTSLLRVIAGLIPEIYPGRVTGEVLYDGKAISTGRRILGVCLTGPWAASRLFCRTVWEELTFSPEADDREARRLLEYFEIGHLAERHPQTLSGGEQQLVLLIAYLCCHPTLLLLDECFAQLSPRKRELLEALIVDLHRAGKTIVLVEHQLPERFTEFAQSILIGQESGAENYEILPTSLDTGALPDIPPDVPVLLETKDLQTADGYPRAIRYPDMRVLRGEIVHVQGAVGAGKTTLFRLLHGLVPSQGTVIFQGSSLKGDRHSALTNATGTVLQSPDSQFFCATVAEEITFAARLHKELDPSWFSELCKVLQLENKLTRNPFNLSHGEKKRCQIASALIRKPTLLILDEPDAGMDQRSQQALTALFTLFRQDGGTILFTSHNPAFVAVLRREGLRVRSYQLSEDGV